MYQLSYCILYIEPFSFATQAFKLSKISSVDLFNGSLHIVVLYTVATLVVNNKQPVALVNPFPLMSPYHYHKERTDKLERKRRNNEDWITKL